MYGFSQPLAPSAARFQLPSVGAPHVRDLRFPLKTFGLSKFDLDIAAIALAPELDRRYEMLCAYLQEDLTRKRPTVYLVLNFLCPDAAAKLVRRDRFSSDAPP